MLRGHHALLVAGGAAAKLYSEIQTSDAPRIPSGIDEFDRVLGVISAGHSDDRRRFGAGDLEQERVVDGGGQDDGLVLVRPESRDRREGQAHVEFVHVLCAERGDVDVAKVRGVG